MENSPITATAASYLTWLSCQRRRYLQDQQPLLPSLGDWCRRLAQGLLLVATGGNLKGWYLKDEIPPANASEVILATVAGYLQKAPPTDSRSLAEHAALLEAFGWAFQRVCLANIISKYHLLNVQQKYSAPLSPDVAWQPEYDALLKRKSDGKRFLYRVEISGNPDKRWWQSREIDRTLQVDARVIAADGILIDCFDTGERVRLDAVTLRESRDPQLVWEGYRNRLLYGYVNRQQGLYAFESTSKAGWEKFAVWEETFIGKGVTSPSFGTLISTNPICYWVNWLPIEQIEAVFVSLPPIMRDDRAADEAIRQIVSAEQDINRKRKLVEEAASLTGEAVSRTFDCAFPQNFRVCFYEKCPFIEVCHR